MTNLKIFDIKDVGNLQENGITNISLEKNNLIFGENGTGKSTIKSIFKFLNDYDNKNLIETFKTEDGGKRSYSFKISYNGNTYEIKKKNNIFDILNNRVAIYDENFFDQNFNTDKDIVYFGEDATYISKKRTLINENEILKNKINENIVSVKDFTSYFDITDENDRKTLIEIYNDTINGRIYNSDIIVNKIKDNLTTFEKIKFSKYLYSNLFGFLRSHKSIKAILKNHLKENTKSDNVIWQLEGINNISNQNCPFCGRKFTKKANKLVEEYKKILTKDEKINYNNLKSFYEYIKNFEDVYKEMSNSIDNLFDIKYITVSRYKKLKSIFNYEIFQSLSSNIDLKLRLPFLKVVLSTKERILLNKLCDFNGYYSSVYNIIEDSSLVVKELDYTSKYEFIESIKKQTEEMNAVKSVVEYIGTYEKNNKRINLLDKGCKTVGKKVLVKKINNYLVQLSSPFKIVQCDDKMKVQLRYYIPKDIKKIDKLPLSEGEKHLLCLAYFMAHVEDNDNLDIIIFDDPMDMCDVSNRVHIISLLSNFIVNSNKTFILLSHDKTFLNTIYRYLNFKDCKSNYLQISDSGLVNYAPSDMEMSVEKSLIDIIKEGENSTLYSDKIAAIMSLRLLNEFSLVDGKRTRLYVGLEKLCTFFVHSSYVKVKSDADLSFLTNEEIIKKFIPFEKLNGISIIDFNKIFDNNYLFKKIDIKCAIELLKELKINDESRIKNALLFRVISEALFLGKKRPDGVLALKVEKVIENSTKMIKNQKELKGNDIDLMKIGVINGLLKGYMHKSYPDTYSLIDVSQREIKQIYTTLMDYVSKEYK